MSNVAIDHAGDGPVETADDQGASIRQFVGSSGAYYERQFDLIGNRSGFTWSFNVAAALLGPIWYGLRGLWRWGLPFTVLEAFSLARIGGACGEI